MSNKLKTTLAATLAATLATGMVVPAMATEKKSDADALYATAYNATVKAQESGKQNDINEARKAIAALEGTDAAWAIGEFSKIVDAPQQVILTKIVDGILRNQKTPKQAEINEIRELIYELKVVNELNGLNWVNEYSSALDEAQGTLMKKAETAAELAVKTGLQADIDAAQKLVDEIKTAKNNDAVAKDWTKAIEDKYLAPLAELKVAGVKTLNSTSVRVDFNKIVDVDTVDADDFAIAKSTDETAMQLVKNIKVSEDKKSVDVELYTALEKGNYDVTITGIKSENNKEMEAYKGTITYASATVSSVELPSTVTFKHTETVGGNLSKFVVVKDTEGRVITNEVKLTYTSNNHAVVNNEGAIYGTGKAKVTVTATKGDDKVSTGTIDLEIKQDGQAVITTYQGFTLSDTNPDSVYSKIEKKVTTLKEGDSTELYLFHQDQYGKEVKGQKATIVENLSTAVKVSGDTITGEKAGTAKLKVEVMNEAGKKVEKIVTFDVKAKSVTKSISLDNTDIKLAAGVDENYVVSKVDQYGDKVKLTDNVKVEYLDGTKVLDATKTEDAKKIAEIEKNVVVSANNGAVNVNAKEATKSAVSVRVTYTENVAGKDVKFIKDIRATVSGTNDVKDYKVSLVGDTVLDKADAKDKLEITVSGTNSNGAVVNVADAKIEVFKTENGKDVDVTDKFTASTRNVKKSTLVANNAEVGKYKVVIKHGTHTVQTMAIEVVNTAATATTIKFNTNAITVSNEGEIVETLKANVSVKDQYGKDLEIKNFSVVGGYKQNQKDGSFDLVITKVNVNGKDLAVNHQMVRVTIK